MKLLFISGNLGGGGAERRLVLLMNYFVEQGHHVSIILFKRSGSYLDFLDNRVEIFTLPKIRYIANFVRVIFTSKILMSMKPNLVFSNLAGSNKIAIIANLLLFNRYRIIIGVVNNPIAYSKIFLLKILYKLPIAIIVNSKGLMEAVVTKWNINPGKVITIYNGIAIGKVNRLAQEAINNYETFERKNTYIISAVGTLCKQKGYDVLLNALNLVLASRDVKLLILGDGPLRSFLEHKTYKLGLTDNVNFIGFQKNPFKWIKNSDVFVLASYYEGFPNVLVEAMACGIPVIATRAPFGPEEIIEDGKTGLLTPVGDHKLLADKILSVFNNKYDIDSMVKKAKIRAMQLFDANIMCEKYEEFFMKIHSK